MAQVTDLNEYRRKHGEAQFMLCENCINDTSMLPIVLQGKNGPFISGLLCLGPKCPEDGTFTEIINGEPK